MANIGRFDSMLLGAYDVILRGFARITDKYQPKIEYYNYQEPEKQSDSVNQVIDRTYVENEEDMKRFQPAVAVATGVVM